MGVRTLRALIAAALLSGVAAAQTASDRFRIDPDRYLSHVKLLASDDLGGRGNGTLGLSRAASYIAGEFRRAGLDPGGDGRTFLQEFDLSSREDGASTLTIASGSGQTAFRIGLHYYPLSAPDSSAGASSSLPSTQPLVFAGYGISAPGLGYDDYAHIDVDGKAVVVFTHEPQENDPTSAFEGTELTPYGAISSKAKEAARRGAKLLVVVEDPTHITDRARTVTWAEDPQIGDYPIPVVRIDRFRLAKAVGTLDFDAIAHTIDATLTEQSRTIAAAIITYPESLVALNPHANNVVGVLKGADPARAQEALVIGAHYDHLGSGSRFALDPQSAGQIHNGADDNASGTALVIEMAHAAARQRTRFGRSLIFATFAGEEVGLLGSNYYVQHAPGGLRRTIAMVNLDMVGRAHGRVMVGGTIKKPLLSALLDAVRDSTSLRLDGFQDGYGDGSSDNEPFEHEHVPTLLFFTGFHDDYHRPTDDWERIDARGAVEIGRIALEIMEKLAK